MSVKLDALFRAMAPLITSGPLEDRGAGHHFFQMMQALVPFDYSVIFAYREAERPIDLFSTFSPDENVVFVSLYQDGPYLLDPFYHAARARNPGVWRMRELAPDRFFASEYYRTYYIQTGLAEEVGFFVPLEDGVTVVLSLMRREASGAFSAADFTAIRHAQPMVEALVRRAWPDLASRFDQQRARRDKGRKKDTEAPADRVWRKLNLTTREARIIELVLQGHSSEAIGLSLGISTGTVKVHRRNVYRKLGISSQTQLMSIYLKNFNQ